MRADPVFRPEAHADTGSPVRILTVWHGDSGRGLTDAEVAGPMRRRRGHSGAAKAHLFSILICLDVTFSWSVCQFRALPRQGPFFLVRPAGRTYLEVEVLYGPGKGNR
jgi:hypothetical protein